VGKERPWPTLRGPRSGGGFCHRVLPKPLPLARRQLQDQPRGVRRRKAGFPGTQKTVVVAEGDFEPRSVGSYSIRAYAGTDARFPYDDFIAGAVRPRDGTVEDVRFSDLDRDGLLDIVVVIRSAGSGGYLSADAFRLQGTTLTLLGSVSGLTRDADPVRALGAELRSRAEPRARPHR
jgi:hypothetical protein